MKRWLVVLLTAVGCNAPPTQPANTDRVEAFRSELIANGMLKNERGERVSLESEECLGLEPTGEGDGVSAPEMPTMECGQTPIGCMWSCIQKTDSGGVVSTSCTGLGDCAGLHWQHTRFNYTECTHETIWDVQSGHILGSTSTCD